MQRFKENVRVANYWQAHQKEHNAKLVNDIEHGAESGTVAGIVGGYVLSKLLNHAISISNHK